MASMCIFNLQKPRSDEITKKFLKFGFLFCCSSEPLIVHAKTEYGGYAPGQRINVDIRVNNRTVLPVSSFKVKLVKVKSSKKKKKTDFR